MSQKPLKIVLDVQHMGKPHRPLDRGATFSAALKIHEAYCALEYAHCAAQALTDAGHHVFLMTSGTYKDRALRANKIGADMYFACHLNSSEQPPETHYSLVEISELAGPLTRRFAPYLAKVLESRLKGVDTGKTKTIKRGERGWTCFNWVKGPAVLFEPVFINHEAGQRIIINGGWDIGQAISSAVALFDWGK